MRHQNIAAAYLRGAMRTLGLLATPFCVFLAVPHSQTSAVGATEPVDPMQFFKETEIYSKANFEQIRTWRGSYQFEDRQLFKVLQTSNQPTSPYWRSVKGEIRFLVDFVNDRLFTHAHPSGSFAFHDVKTGKPRSFPVHVEDNVCILTSEHWLDSPSKPQPQFGLDKNVLGLPPEGGKLIRKWAASDARSASLFGQVFHPREMFSPAGFPVQDMMSAFHREFGAKDAAARVDELGQVEITKEGANWVFRHQIGGTQGTKLILHFDDTTARNWVASEIWSAGKKVNSRHARYDVDGGIYYPVWFEATTYDADGKTPMISRKLTRLTSDFNVPVSDDDFGVLALGAVNGTRMVDRITSEITVFRDGDWVSIADYNAGDISRREADARKTLLTMAVIALVGVLIALIAILGWRRMQSASGWS